RVLALNLLDLRRHRLGQPHLQIHGARLPHHSASAENFRKILRGAPLCLEEVPRDAQPCASTHERYVARARASSLIRNRNERKPLRGPLYETRTYALEPASERRAIFAPLGALQFAHS